MKMGLSYGSNKTLKYIGIVLHWRHNEHDDVSNHQLHGCLLNRLFRRRSKKTSKLHVTGLWAGNSPGTGEFPAQMPVTQKMFPFDDVIMVGRFITIIKIWYVQSSACISCNTISQGMMKYVKPSMQGRRFMIYQHASFNVWNVRKRRFSYIWINSIFFYNWNYILTAIVVRCIPLGNADNKNDKNNNNDNNNSLFSKKLHRCYNTTIII